MCVGGRVNTEMIGIEMKTLSERAQTIQLLILDVDGVMTDGRLLFTPEGEEIKAFHVLDGQGIKLLQRAGISVAVISGRRSKSLEMRLKALNIEHAYLGYEDKLTPFFQLLETFQLQADQVAFMGDDWIDLPVLTRVGLAASVPNAVEVVKHHAHWISEQSGGFGAVRAFAEWLLKEKGLYDGLLNSFLADVPKDCA